MELLIALVAFYLGHALVVLSPGAVLFRGRGRRARALRGERAALVGLWPPSASLVAERTLAGEWFGGGTEPGLPELHGRHVRVGGRTVGRLSTAQGAAALRRAIEAVEDGATPRDRDASLAGAVAHGLDVAGARDRMERALAASRPLGALGAAYALLLFLVVPVLMVAIGDELAWLFVLLPVALVHLVLTGATWRARGVALDESAFDRALEVLTGFLFPPALMHARRDLLLAAASGWHPAALAPLRLDGEPLRAFLAGELALVRGLARDGDSAALAAEGKGILSIAGSFGWAEEDLLRPRAASDPLAAAHCPRCGSAYVRRVERCLTCGGITVPDARSPAPGETVP